MKKLFFFACMTLAMFACADKNAPSNTGDNTGDDTGGSTITNNGALPGLFRISTRAYKIRFSQGNLQYHCTNHTWRFAHNQYDTIGDTNKNIYFVGDNYNDWIDLFAWGTGNYPTLCGGGSVYYQSFIDWGKNAISNGGNKRNLWFTLSWEDWRYIFEERPNAKNLFGLGSVNGVNGVILLPDDWELPSGCSFTASTTKGLMQPINAPDYKDNYDYYNYRYSDPYNYYQFDDHDNFLDNIYTKEQWSAMEAAGAVFLPAAGGCGQRYDDSSVNVTGVGTYGQYWAKNSESGFYAAILAFNKGRLEFNNIFDNRESHLSVRLVQLTEVKAWDW